MNFAQEKITSRQGDEVDVIFSGKSDIFYALEKVV